jgi:urease accessory protein
MRAAEPIVEPWRASLHLGFSFENEKTVLRDKRFEGPLVVQKPFYPEGGAVCHGIVVHPPAGIAGGDELELNVRIKDQAHALLTTPGAGKWYRTAGAWARQKLSFEVQGALEWLPQETIVFDGALADMECEVKLGPQATYIGWEILCLGRTGSGERFRKGCISVKNAITRNEKPLWLERGTIPAGGRPAESPAGLGGRTVCATLLAAAPALDAAVLAACRQVEDVAVTLLPGLLVARHLGDSSEAAKQRFIRLWEILRPAVSSRAAEEPRIWRT